MEELNKIKYSIQYNFDYYHIVIDKTTDKESIDRNIYKLIAKLIKNLRLTDKYYKAEIIGSYNIIIRI